MNKILFFALGVSFLTLTGCGGPTLEQWTSIEEAAVEGNTSIDPETGDLTTVTDYGTYSTGSQASFPPEWPDNFPMPESYTLTSSKVQEDEGYYAENITYTTNLTPSEVYALYRDSIPGQGWEIFADSEYGVSAERGDVTVAIAAITPGGDSGATVAISTERYE